MASLLADLAKMVWCCAPSEDLFLSVGNPSNIYLAFLSAQLDLGHFVYQMMYLYLIPRPSCSLLSPRDFPNRSCLFDMDSKNTQGCCHLHLRLPLATSNRSLYECLGEISQYQVFHFWQVASEVTIRRAECQVNTEIERK